MTIAQLNYIIAVEKYLSFVDAAEACFVTQPALSMQIKKLEEHLDVQIFDRSQTPISVTKIGEEIIAQAKRTVKEFQQIYGLIKHERGDMNGEIRLGVIPTVAPYLLPLFLKRFNEAFSEVKLLIEEITTDKILDKLSSGNLDIGILATPIGHETFKEIPLYYEELLAYVATDNELFNKKYILSQEIDLNKLWLLEEGHCLRSQIENFCTLKQKKKIVSQLNFKTGSLETIIKLVDKYKGITLIPELSTLDFTDQQRFCIKHFEGEKPIREIAMIIDKNYPRKAIVDAFKNIIQECLPETISREKKYEVLKIN